MKNKGNRLTRRPCKGDEFEFLIFEAKRQNAGIWRSRQKMFATWTFISIGRRVTQEWKFAVRLRGDSILLFKGKKNIRILWFSIVRIISGRHSLFQFFPLLNASVPERWWQRRSHRLQQGSIVTPCPAVGRSVSIFVHLLILWGNVFRNVREVLLKDVNTLPTPWWSYDSMRDVYMCRNVREVLARDVNTPPHPLMIIRQHVQRVHVP